MSYRTILAFLPSTTRAPQVLGCASALAGAHDAHLVALVVQPDFVIPYAFGAEVPPQFFETPEEVKRAELEEMRQQFDKFTREADVEAEWRLVDKTRSLIGDVITEHALSADLVVLPQATGEEWGPWSELPDRVILNCGRPVIVVPEDLKVSAAPKRALLAWSDSAQSARAAFDALPALVRCDSVEVLSVSTAAGGESVRSLAVDQVALALARHGVNAEAATDIREHVNAGEAILDHAREKQVDLLVMGCYGHSRFRETLLGGVSRSILQDMTLPVLMAH